MRNQSTPCGRYVLILIAALVAPAVLHAETPPAPLSAEAFIAHVRYLASDELEGRGSGTPGNDQAAEYIARQFADLGLKPAGDAGTWFQQFPVQLQPVLENGSKLSFAASKEPPAGPLAVGVDFLPFPFSGSAAFSGDVVFAGYGIQNPDKNRDDYVHLDAHGKVVVMFRGEPPGDVSSNGESSPHAALTTKTFVARQQGAAAVIMVSAKPAAGEKDALYEWPASLDGPLGADCGVPVFHVTRAVANRLLAEHGEADALGKLQDALDAGGYASRAVAGLRAEGKAEIVRATRQTRNVVAILPGAGPHADEYLVIGAHFDHLGVAVPRTTFGKHDEKSAAAPQVHNGADDNASGTAGVIELARAFKAAPLPPRSLIFVTFSGEEIGLLGSKFFVEHPPVPTEKMAAMINMDMIGRLPETRLVQVFGTEAAEEFKDLLPRLAEKDHLGFRGTGSAFGPSDHTSFYTQKVPALHFFTGLHADYHLPTDDADKINAPGAADVLHYVYDVALALLQMDHRPTYVRVAPPPDGAQRTYRVRMGIMPSYADSTEGMGVDGVLKDSPAAEAGMKDGDVIITIGGAAIRNVYDYMAALNRQKPGDVVEVVVRREGKDVPLNVKLAGAK